VISLLSLGQEAERVAAEEAAAEKHHEAAPAAAAPVKEEKVGYKKEVIKKVNLRDNDKGEAEETVRQKEKIEREKRDRHWGLTSLFVVFFKGRWKDLPKEGRQRLCSLQGHAHRMFALSHSPLIHFILYTVSLSLLGRKSVRYQYGKEGTATRLQGNSIEVYLSSLAPIQSPFLYLLSPLSCSLGVSCSLFASCLLLSGFSFLSFVL
jgi:hypothetical protein